MRSTMVCISLSCTERLASSICFQFRGSRRRMFPGSPNRPCGKAQAVTLATGRKTMRTGTSGVSAKFRSKMASRGRRLSGGHCWRGNFVSDRSRTSRVTLPPSMTNSFGANHCSNSIPPYPRWSSSSCLAFPVPSFFCHHVIFVRFFAMPIPPSPSPPPIKKK